MQGTAADIIKRAMIDVDRWLRDSRLEARLLMQVHDELVFEVPENEAEKTADVVRYVMESVADISVPLHAEAGSGPSWAKAH
jgi:DNA polymerase-1